MVSSTNQESFPAPEEPGGDYIRQILTRAFQVDAPRAGFQSELGESLGREFASLFASDGVTRTVNGTIRQPAELSSDATYEDEPVSKTPSPEESIEDLDPEDVSRSSIPFSPVRRARRWATWGTSAASLLVVLSWWVSSPRYTWASMLDAIRENEWIEVVVQVRPGLVAEGWLSDELGVTAIRKDEQIEFNDYEKGFRLVRGMGASVLGQQKLNDLSRNNTGSRFLSLLLGTLDDRGTERFDADLEFKVVSESWKRLNDGRGELRVSLALGDASEKIIHLRFVLHPDSHLPLQVVVEEPEAESRVLYFTYPIEGPQDIYVLGVPRDLPIVPMARAAEHATQANVAANVRKERSDSRLPTQAPHVADSAANETTPKRAVAQARSVEQMTERVNALMRAHWSSLSIAPVDLATDEEFFRRAYLDLLGRIPTVNEVRSFLDGVDSNRRMELLEELVERYDHASHLATVWRSFLIPETADLTELGGAVAFELWLTERFKKNQPYDQLVTDLLLAEGRTQEGGSLLFYAALKLKPEEIAGQTSRAFLGMRLECAQCHDDFFDDDWTQRDFWAYAAFFAQMSQPQGKFDRVSPVLRIRDVPYGDVMLPESEEVIAPRFPLERDPALAADGLSRRAQLAAWITSPDNRHFARATVNRVWAQLFGRGLVNPIDDMRADNHPICPEVLDELADNFIASGFDLRQLYLTLTRSEAYQLSSSAAQDEPIRREHFAQMNLKCFTAEQLYDCITVATGFNAASKAPGSRDGLERASNFGRQAFLEEFQAPPGVATDYQAGIAQALSLMNGPITFRATEESTSGLLASLQAPFFTDKTRVEILFLATVSRLPSDSEQDLILTYLKEAKTLQERNRVFGDTLWSLLNSAEFTLIH